MEFRFTLTNGAMSQVINEPDGWKDIKIKLERSEYHSLIELFETNFFFYNANSLIDGGRVFINDVLDQQGLNAIISLLVEISENNDNNFDTLFIGNLDLSTMHDTSDGDKFYKFQCSLTPSDLWATVLNRRSIDIDVNSAIDLDGNSVNAQDVIELGMPSQVVRKIYNADFLNPQTLFTRDLTTGTYIQVDYDEVSLSEFKTKYNLGFTYNPDVPVPLFEMAEDGEYTFVLSFEVSYYKRLLDQSVGTVANTYEYADTFLDFYIKKNNDAAVALTIQNNLSGSDKSTTYSINTVLNLKKGDNITIYGYVKLQPTNSAAQSGSFIFYGKNDNITLEEIILSGMFAVWNAGTAYVTNQNVSIPFSANFESTYWHCINNNTNKPPASNPLYWVQTTCNTTFFITGARTVANIDIILPNPPSGTSSSGTTINIVAQTTMENTNADSMLVLDVAQAILDRILESRFSIYSEYLGGVSQGYVTNGCGHQFVILKGMHVRGYTFTDKPFFLSLNSWWEGMEPIFCLGMGPETIDGIEKLRIEPKSHFYDDSPILRFSNVDGIIRTWDLSQVHKSVNIGYQTWSAESDTGIDDPQSKHSYSTPYKIIGVDTAIFSDFIAAGLAIEQTRRNTIEGTKDWRLDNNTMIIALKESDDSPQGMTIETGENIFSSITNLLNPETRYNIRLTPYRNFQRWLRFLSAPMQMYLSKYFKFASAEGNFTMSVGGNIDPCDIGAWTENQDIAPSSNPFFTPEVYQFDVPLSWTDYKTIRDNRTRCIEISKSTTDYKLCHIQSLEYSIQHGRATIKGWIK